jgi:hypothetical protein
VKIAAKNVKIAALSRQMSWKSQRCRGKIVEYHDFVAVKSISEMKQ